MRKATASGKDLSRLLFMPACSLPACGTGDAPVDDLDRGSRRTPVWSTANVDASGFLE